jgi:hypothetical protein
VAGAGGRAARALITLGRWVGRFAYVLAWLIVLLALAAVALVEGPLPFLRDLARDRLARELGPLGPGVVVDDVEVDWLGAAVELRGVRVERQGGGLFLDRVRLGLAPLDTNPSLRRIHVVGRSRLEIYDGLLEDLRAIAEENEQQRAEPGSGAPADLPQIVVEDLRLEIQTPEGVVPVGQLRLTCDLAPRDVALLGRIHPSFSPPGAGEVDFSGHLDESGLTLRADASDLPVDVSHLGRAEYLDVLPFDDPRGTLRLSASLRVPSDRAESARGELRLELEDASFSPRVELPEVERMGLSFEALFEPPPGQLRLFAPSSWSARARLDGHWLGTDVRAVARAGRSTRTDAALEAHVRLPDLSPGHEMLELTLAMMGEGEAARQTRRHWEMIEPSGRIDAGFALRVPAPWAPPRDWQLAGALDLGGRVDGAWFGLTNWRGERQGIPVPVENMRGQVLFVREPSLPQPELAALVDLSGEHFSGFAYGSGVVGRPEKPGDGADVEIELRVPEMQIAGPLLEQGLPGMFVTKFVQRDFNPEGGTVNGLVRLRADGTTHGLQAALDFEVRGATVSWRGLPVPLTDADMDVAVRWAQFPDGLPYRTGRQSRTAGVLVEGTARVGNQEGSRVAARVTWREERPDSSPGTRSRLTKDGHLLNPSTLAVDVDIERMLLRGSDWAALETAVEPVARAAEEFSPKGWANASYSTCEDWPLGPRPWSVEVVPGEVGIQPRQFRMDMRNLRGRVIVRGEDVPAGPDAPPGTPAASTGSTGVHLVGTWPYGSDAEVAASAEIGEGGRGTALVLAAGVDPSNRSLLGALREAVAQTAGGALDLSALEVTGSLDFSGELPVAPPDEAPAPMDYRVHLRDNELGTGTFRLSRMRGLLLQQDGILRSERIDALLGDLPVRLEDAVFVEAGALERVDGARALLGRAGLSPEPDSYVLMARITGGTPMPLDREHLERLFTEESLTTALETAGLTGEVAFEDLEIALTGTGGGRTELGVHGEVELRDASVLLGLPVEIDSGAVTIQSFVLDAGRVRAWADLDDVSGRIADRAIRDTSLRLTYVDGRLSVDELEARFDFGGPDDGRLTSLGGAELGGSALALDTAPPHGFEVALQLDAVRLDGLLEGLFDTGLAEPGRANGTLRLTGRPSDLSGIRGSGSAALYEARLFSIPVASELFTQLGLDETATFQQMSTRFDVSEGVVTMKGMSAKSPLAKLVGEGTIDLDGSVRVDLEVRYSLVDKLGPLTRLLYIVQSSLLRVAIRGDLARPFVVLRNSFAELFSGFDDAPRALPLPPVEPLPERF